MLVREVKSHPSWPMNKPTVELVLSYYFQRAHSGISMDTITLEELPAMNWIKKEIQEGVQKGLQQGLQEGLQTGRQEGEQRTLLRLLKRRFGDVSVDYKQRILQADTTQLEAWLDNIFDAETIEAVFK